MVRDAVSRINVFSGSGWQRNDMLLLCLMVDIASRESVHVKYYNWRWSSIVNKNLRMKTTTRRWYAPVLQSTWMFSTAEWWIRIFEPRHTNINTAAWAEWNVAWSDCHVESKQSHRVERTWDFWLFFIMFAVFSVARHSKSKQQKDQLNVLYHHPPRSSSSSSKLYKQKLKVNAEMTKVYTMKRFKATCLFQ